MAPPSAYHDDVVETAASVHANRNDEPATATHEPGLSKQQAAKHEVSMQMPSRRATDKDLYKEREYQKGRLVLAFRIFAKYGFDEGVAGHITLRVRFPRVQLMDASLQNEKLITPRTQSNQIVSGSTPLESHGHYFDPQT